MSTQAKAALLPILNAKYQQIAEIEEQWGIRFKEGDMRARIEYFHDAVRALSQGEDPYGKYSRLSVEHLAYDLSQLRQAQAKPAGIINKGTVLSAGSALVRPEEAGASTAKKPDRQARAELSTLYKDYTVMFAAIFAEVADMNFKAREEEMESAIADIGLVEQVLQKVMNGQMSKQQAEHTLDEIEMDELREKMIVALRAKKSISTHEHAELAAQLKGIEEKMKAEMIAVDQSHMHYVTAQLAVYEQSKETVKRLAAQGMNIAGKFVDQALAKAAGQGRGQGM